MAHECCRRVCASRSASADGITINTTAVSENDDILGFCVSTKFDRLPNTRFDPVHNRPCSPPPKLRLLTLVAPTRSARRASA
eukprot:6548627-Prymnesium_polylepis.1